MIFARHSIPLSATLVRIFVSHFTYPSQFSSTHPTFSGTIFAKNFKYHFRKASHLAFRKAFHPTFRKAFQARIPPFQARFSQRISNTIFVKHPISLRSEEHTSELQSRPHLVCR